MLFAILNIFFLLFCILRDWDFTLFLVFFILICYFFLLFFIFTYIFIYFVGFVIKNPNLNPFFCVQLRLLFLVAVIVSAIKSSFSWTWFSVTFVDLYNFFLGFFCWHYFPAKLMTIEDESWNRIKSEITKILLSYTKVR